MRVILIVGLVFTFALSLGSLQDARGETSMQCMEKCIQYEGGSSATNKETCKNRCGPAALENKPGGMRDCMGEFKACNKSCGKEKIVSSSPCHKRCKARQMNCV